MSSGGAGTERSIAAAKFDRRALEYDAVYDARSGDGYALRARMQVVLQFAGRGPGDALDVGMGPGRLLELLARRGWTVTGLDASPEMIAAAHARLPGNDETLVQGVIEGLPFTNESFDVVIATGVLEYSAIDPALSELARVLRPDGVVIVSYPNPASLYGLWKTRAWYPLARALKRALRLPPPSLPSGAPLVSESGLRAGLAERGLRVERVAYTSYLVLPSPLDELAPRLAQSASGLAARYGRRSARRLATQIVYLARNDVPEPIAAKK